MPSRNMIPVLIVLVKYNRDSAKGSGLCIHSDSTGTNGGKNAYVT